MKIKTALNYLKKGVGGILLTSTLISLGALSFAGIMAFMAASFPLAPLYIALGIGTAAFILAGLVEVQVYKEAVFHGLKSIFLPEFLQTKLIIHELKSLCKNEHAREYSVFLKDYHEIKTFIEITKGFKLSREQKAHKNVAKKQIKVMQKNFAQLILNDTARQAMQNKIKNYLGIYFNEQQIAELKQNIRYRYGLLLASIFLNVTGGISCAFVTAVGIEAAITTAGTYFAFTLSATVLSAIIWPIAVVAALAYVVLIYQTIINILTKPNIQEWLKKQLKCFDRIIDEKTQEKEHILKYALRMTCTSVLLAIVLGISGFATLATAGTWWKLMEKFPVILSAITVAANGTTALIFNVNNSLETFFYAVNKFSLSELTEKYFSKISTTLNNENWGQRLNPFRAIIKIIEFPYTACVLIGHLISIGAASDQFEGLTYEVNAFMGAAGEFMVDFPSFNEDEHNHSHGNVVETLLKIVLAPLYVLSATWAFAANRMSAQNTSFKAELMNSFGVEQPIDISQVSLPTPHASINRASHYHALKKINSYLDETNRNINATNDSATQKTALYETLRNNILSDLNAKNSTDQISERSLISLKIERRIDKLKIEPPNPIVQEKINALTALRNDVLKSKQPLDKICEKHINENREVYNKQRSYFFRPKTTATTKTVEEIHSFARSCVAA